MRAKSLKLAAAGFVYGMLIGNGIAWLTGGTVVNTFLAERLGSNAGSVILQTLLSGLLGAVAMGGVVLHEIESWSLARSALTHCLLIVGTYTVTALILRWADGWTELLIMISIQLVVYFIIWAIMFLRYRAEVQRLNELLKESREADGEQAAENLHYGAEARRLNGLLQESRGKDVKKETGQKPENK